MVHGQRGESLGETREELIEVAGLESTFFTKATPNPHMQKITEGAAV